MKQDILTTYYSNRPFMQSGDCLLWQSKSIVGWLIRLFTGHHVNHASLVVHPGKFGPFISRMFVIEALEQGVILRLISERLRSYSGKVWWYTLKPEYQYTRDRIIRWAIEQEGTPYDYHSLFRQAFGRVSAEASRYFCSELCYFAWMEAGIPVARDKAPRPGDIPGLGIFNDPILIFGESE